MQQSPQGLSRVYFCAHPQDHKFYLEEISHEILAFQNCAVWYDEEPEKEFDPAELSEALAEMNLFVFPVTRALLTESNRALDFEIRFALENHVPLLPIIKEKDLEELFDQKFGSIQFLAEDKTDEAARPYSEKLERFLSTVIVGDELAARIKSAFDAYIFLSYRKKDRRQAVELMKLIHKNEFTRDIAIWYDEYLIPGENFNDAIRQAFEKSSLFVLNVTPSILEKTVGKDGKPQDNYIKQIEYPMAITAKKSILPAETVKTDRAELEEEFPDLPPCVSASDGEELFSALFSAFGSIALRKSNDPEHNFFIGLAYLNGIDVEMNKTLGAELIRSAAESDVPAAMKKLISMYEEGDGIERSIEKAIEWQKRLVNKYEEIYLGSGDERDGHEWFWELIYLSDALGIAGNSSAQTECAEKAVRIAHAQFKDHKTYNASRNLFVGYERLGNAMKAIGNLSAAKQSYQGGLEFAQYNLEAERTDEAIRDLSLIYNNLGDIARSEGVLYTARENYLNALKLREEIAERCTEQAKRDIPVCCDKLGDIESAEGNYSAARGYYLKGLGILENIAESTDTVLAKRDLSVCCGKLGDLEVAEADLKAAKGYYEKSLGYAEEILRRRDTAEAKHDLIAAYVRLAFVALEGGKTDLTKSYYLSALDIAQKALEHSDSPVAKRDLWLCYTGMADVLKRGRELNTAMDYAMESLRISSELLQASEAAAAERDHFKSVSTLGDVALESGDISTAIDCYLKGLEILQKLPDYCINVKSLRDALLTCTKLANVNKSDGDLLSAREYYLRALDTANEILNISYSTRVENDMSIICSSLGEVTQALGYTNEARDYFMQSLVTAESVVRHCQTPSTLDALGVANFKISFYESSEDRMTYLANALDIYEKLTKEHPENERFKRNLGLVKEQMKN